MRHISLLHRPISIFILYTIIATVVIAHYISKKFVLKNESRDNEFACVSAFNFICRQQ
ncbi:hypothetical protein LINGRAHAP2_LOCUS26984 [Linum grandiflorum]